MSVSEHQPPATSSASKPQSSSHPRSSSSRRKKDQYVRRPPNPFMLFRSYINDTKLLNLKHQGDLSAHVAKLWNVMSEEKKDEWRVKADEEKRKHKLMYPGYSFQPGKKQRIDEVMAAPKKAMVSANPTSRVKGGQKKLAIVTASSSKTRSDCSPPPPSPTESEQSDAAESDVECEIFPKPFEPPVLYLEQRQFDDEHAEKNAFEVSTHWQYPSHEQTAHTSSPRLRRFLLGALYLPRRQRATHTMISSTRSTP